MARRDPNPLILAQNRLFSLLARPEERLEFYRRVLQRRLDRAGRDSSRLKVPRLRGLRLRLPGKPFHATPEFFFQEEGETRFDLPRETIAARPGDALLVPAWMPHGERWSGRPFLNLIVMFQAESFSLHLGYLEAGKGPLRCGPVDRFPSAARFAALRYAEEMAQAEGDATSRRLLHGLHVALLARLLQGLRPPGGAAPARSGLAARCREMIDVYASKMDFSVAWLARELGCSPDHLSRHFRARTGHRIVEVVHRRRIEHARRLLRDSGKNVAEIAWACGFAQPSHFTRVFKAHTGVTPKAFRAASPR